MLFRARDCAVVTVQWSWVAALRKFSNYLINLWQQRCYQLCLYLATANINEHSPMLQLHSSDQRFATQQDGFRMLKQCNAVARSLQRLNMSNHQVQFWNAMHVISECCCLTDLQFHCSFSAHIHSSNAPLTQPQLCLSLSLYLIQPRTRFECTHFLFSAIS